MHSRNGSESSQTAGGIKIWTAILILGLCCVIGVVALQIQEYLFYEQAPSVWHKPGASVGAVPEIAPMPPPGLAAVDEPSLDSEDAEEEDSESSDDAEAASGSEPEDTTVVEDAAAGDESVQ